MRDRAGTDLQHIVRPVPVQPGDAVAAAAPAAGAAELVITRAPEVCLLGTATPDEQGIFDPVVKIKRERPQVAVLVLGPVPNPRGIAAAFAA